jgi:hypothetical protein
MKCKSLSFWRSARHQRALRPLLLSILVLFNTNVLANDNVSHRFTISVVCDNENRHIKASIVGAKITDDDLKVIHALNGIESLFICSSSPSRLSSKGFANAVKGKPIKELSVSSYSGGKMDFLLGIDEISSLQSITVTVNVLSEDILSILATMHPKRSPLELSISVLDGEAVTLETLLKLESMTVFSEISLVPRLNAKSAVEVTHKLSPALRRLKIVVPQDIQPVHRDQPQQSDIESRDKL